MASLPPFYTSVSLRLYIAYLLASSYFFLIIGIMCFRCLLSAGPNMLLAFLRESRAALKIALLEDFKHFCSKVIFCLTICATIVLSSTISLGLKSSKLCVLGVVEVDDWSRFCDENALERWLIFAD